MSRPARFTQVDVNRALAGARQAGFIASECVINADGSIRVVFKDGPSSTRKNPLERLRKQ